MDQLCAISRRTGRARPTGTAASEHLALLTAVGLLGVSALTSLGLAWGDAVGADVAGRAPRTGQPLAASVSREAGTVSAFRQGLRVVREAAAVDQLHARRWVRYGENLDSLPSGDLGMLERAGLLTEDEHAFLSVRRSSLLDGDAVARDQATDLGILHPSYKAQFEAADDVVTTARLALHDFTRSVRDRFRRIFERLEGPTHAFTFRSPALEQVVVARPAKPAWAKAFTAEQKKILKAVGADVLEVTEGEHFEARLMPNERFEDGAWALRVTTEDGKLSAEEGTLLADALAALPDRFNVLEQEGVVLRLTDGPLAAPEDLPWHSVSVDLDQAEQGLTQFADWLEGQRRKQTERAAERARRAGEDGETPTTPEPLLAPGAEVDELTPDEVTGVAKPDETVDEVAAPAPKDATPAPVPAAGDLGVTRPVPGRVSARIELPFAETTTTKTKRTTDVTTTGGVETARNVTDEVSTDVKKVVAWNEVFAELRDAHAKLLAAGGFRERADAAEWGGIIRTAGKGETQWDLVSKDGGRAVADVTDDLEPALQRLAARENLVDDFEESALVTPGVLAVEFNGEGFAKHARSVERALAKLDGRSLEPIIAGEGGFSLVIDADGVRAHFIDAKGASRTEPLGVQPSSASFGYWLDEQLRKVGEK